MPNCCKCSEERASKQKCLLCGDLPQCIIVEAMSSENQPQEDREIVRLYPEDYVEPEFSRKFMRLYPKTQKAEEKPQ